VYRFWGKEITQWFMEGRRSRGTTKTRPPILKCARCGADRGFEIDHILPKSRGGPDDLDNYQVLCRNCNRAKSNHIEEDR